MATPNYRFEKRQKELAKKKKKEEKELRKTAAKASDTEAAPGQTPESDAASST